MAKEAEARNAAAQEAATRSQDIYRATLKAKLQLAEERTVSARRFGSTLNAHVVTSRTPPHTNEPLHSPPVHLPTSPRAPMPAPDRPQEEMMRERSLMTQFTRIQSARVEARRNRSYSTRERTLEQRRQALLEKEAAMQKHIQQREEVGR